MELITKKEFYANHANQRDKRNILWAVGVAYICAALSMAAGLITHDYYVLIDVALIVGLTLGIQLAQSRACAVLLLVYACFNTIITLVTTGRVAGWLIILVGIWAVIGTFNFYKDYQKYLQSCSRS